MYESVSWKNDLGYVGSSAICGVRRYGSYMKGMQIIIESGEIMNTKIEEEFVHLFCSSKVRDRLLFELGSKSKRRNALSRFSHNYNNVLINEYMIEITQPNSDVHEIFKLMKEHNATDEVYCISFNPEIDGKSLPLIEALQVAVGYGLPSIIICGERLGYFESEQELGPPKRFILKRSV